MEVLEELERKLGLSRVSFDIEADTDSFSSSPEQSNYNDLSNKPEVPSKLRKKYSTKRKERNMHLSTDDMQYVADMIGVKFDYMCKLYRDLKDLDVSTSPALAKNVNILLDMIGDPAGDMTSRDIDEQISRINDIIERTGGN